MSASVHLTCCSMDVDAWTTAPGPDLGSAFLQMYDRQALVNECPLSGILCGGDPLIRFARRPAVQGQPFVTARLRLFPMPGHRRVTYHPATGGSAGEFWESLLLSAMTYSDFLTACVLPEAVSPGTYLVLSSLWDWQRARVEDRPVHRAVPGSEGRLAGISPCDIVVYRCWGRATDITEPLNGGGDNVECEQQNILLADGAVRLWACLCVGSPTCPGASASSYLPLVRVPPGTFVAAERPSRWDPR
jgi:hypothetical protein